MTADDVMKMFAGSYADGVAATTEDAVASLAAWMADNADALGPRDWGHLQAIGGALFQNWIASQWESSERPGDAVNALIGRTRLELVA